MGGLQEDLRDQVARGDAVVVAGAGVAAAASGGHPQAGWLGLLESGVAFCEDNVPGLPPGWASATRSFIRMGDVSSLLTAAQQVTDRLGGREGGEYRRWLHETVGSLPLVDPAVPEALLSLGIPVATTNYDDLIERSRSGWGQISWRDGAKVQRAIRGRESKVVHVHGHWDEPASVVLGISSYDAVLGDAAAQGLQTALATMRSLILVGVGAGVDDPNIVALRAWLAEAFGGTEYRHFRLCLECEVDSLAAEHKGERIVPVAYGTHQGELAGFLRSLKPQPRASVPKVRAPQPAGLPARQVTIGRDESLSELVANMMADPPVPSVVLGPGGIGKTNLTLAALYHPDVATRFGERRFFVRCEAAPSAAAAAGELATALGVTVVVGADLLAGVLAGLAGAPAVVALDNAETPWEADTLATEDLLARVAQTPGVALVASLRGAERPSGPSWGAPVRVGPLGPTHARTLFLSVTGSGFDHPELAELLADMGGIPLAIELLAHAAEGEPDLASLADRWRRERVHLLSKGLADHRLLSAAASVEASWTGPLMDEPARRLLALLGRLPDGVAISDLSPLLPGEGPGAANTLRRRGLGFDESGRLRTYPPVRHHIEAAHPPWPTTGTGPSPITAASRRTSVPRLADREEPTLPHASWPRPPTSRRL